MAIVLLNCWIEVLCQSTLGNMDNKKCQDSSTEYLVLMNILHKLEEKLECNSKHWVLHYVFL